MSKVQVTWEDGTVEVFTDIPATVEEAKARAALESKYKKKIKTYTRLGSASSTSGQTDRDSSSQTPPADNTAKPVIKDKNPHHRDEEPDYRNKFPDKYTPQGMRRNKWGELIYE